MSNHTPTPWHCGTFRENGDSPGIDIGAIDGSNIATVHHDRRDRSTLESKSNAAHIVRCVNERDELLQALILLSDRERFYRHCHDRCGDDDIHAWRAWDKMQQAGDAARKLIEKAEQS